MGDLNSKIDELMERFRKLSETGTQIVLLDEISRLVLDVIGNVRYDTTLKSSLLRVYKNKFVSF